MEEELDEDQIMEQRIASTSRETCRRMRIATYVVLAVYIIIALYIY